MIINVKDIVGIAEIADQFRVRSSTVCNWRARYKGTDREFPKPITTVSGGMPIWNIGDVTEWGRRVRP